MGPSTRTRRVSTFGYFRIGGCAVKAMAIIFTVLFASSTTLYADAIFVNDARFLSLDADGYDITTQEDHWHEIVMPPSPFSGLDRSRYVALRDGVSSIQARHTSDLTGLRFNSSNHVQATFPDETTWVWQSFKMRSIF